MDTTALTIVAVAIAVLAAAAAIVVVVRSSGRLTLWSALIPLAVLGVASVIGVVPTAAAAPTSRSFSVFHLAYLVAGIALPLVGLVLLVGGAVRGARWPVWVIAVALVVPAPVTWYGTHVAPFRLGVERGEVELPAERAGSDPVRVGVLSDLQTTRITSYEERAVTKLLGLRPDIIVIPGDLFQGSDRQFRQQLPAFRRLLGRLEAPGGVYAVRGDTDHDDRLDELVEGTGIEILDYEVDTTTVGDRTIRIGGNKLLWAPLPAVAMRTELMASDPGDIRILVSHRPDVVLLLPPDSGVDLTVSGHTHAGQIALPILGPITTASRVSRSVASGGTHEVDGNAIFVQLRRRDGTPRRAAGPAPDPARRGPRRLALKPGGSAGQEGGDVLGGDDVDRDARTHLEPAGAVDPGRDVGVPVERVVGPVRQRVEDDVVGDVAQQRPQAGEGVPDGGAGGHQRPGSAWCR
ncbi:metallophosphoesterase [Aquihabitans daechungensis]|uniref:metallophosphoesterase n=1 Tax=Aquihabitans daechungensis TaxID=1052257 RepID=UPI003B9E42E7